MKSPFLAAIMVVILTAAPAFSQYNLTTLATFSGFNAPDPASLILSGNTLYGLLGQGGPNSEGEIFSIPTTGGTPSVVGLTTSGNTGRDPEPDILLSGGTIYGSTQQGGPGIPNGDGGGTVYSVPVTGGTPTVLGSFTIGGATGQAPVGLVLSGSTIYGVANEGGDLSLTDEGYGGGTVFSMPVGGGTPTLLATFTGANGDSPTGALVQSGNTLYGTTRSGGQYGFGEVYSVPTTGGTPTVVASFINNVQNYTVGPESLIISGNTLYGTTQSGGSYGDGEIYSVPVTGGTPTVLANFNGSNGANPSYGNLTLNGNTLYGTTTAGGANGVGEIFSLPTSGGTPSVLYSFTTANANPEVGFVMDSSGTMYVTTGSGESTVGTLAKITPPAPLVTQPQTTSAPVTSQTVTVGSPSTPGTVEATFSSSNDIGGELQVTSGIAAVSTVDTSGNIYDAGPINFELPADGSVVQVWDITDTSGEPTAPVTLTLDFDPTGMTSDQIAGLDIEHYTDGTWQTILPTSVTDGTITFTTDSFSPFALSEIPEPGSFSLLAVCGLGLLVRKPRAPAEAR